MSPDAALGVDAGTAVELYRLMVRIREFDTLVPILVGMGRIRGTAHSAIGQEAVAVGACSALRPDDRITSTHRGHGHAIAKGVAIEAMMAELFGRETGSCRGKGGSMHIADFSVGMLGANGVVGGGFGIATGAALADRAAAFGFPGVSVDGMDVLAVRHAVGAAVDRARAGEGPTLVVAACYRFGGHHVGDAETYRDPADADPWLARDPLVTFRSALVAAAVLDEAGADAIVAEEVARVAAAVETAEADPQPDASSAWTDIVA